MTPFRHFGPLAAHPVRTTAAANKAMIENFMKILYLKLIASWRFSGEKPRSAGR